MKGTNLSFAFGTSVIYSDASFQIQELDKVGIVGVNGAGKTTLFQLILGNLEPDKGTIMIPKGKRIGYLPQELSFDSQHLTVLDYLLSARPIATLEQNLTTLYEEVAILTDESPEMKRKLKEISKTQELLEYYDCYQAESQLFRLIESMQIDVALLDLPVYSLSGGQKSKVAFAHLLYSNPEILLLDEPTNHLDKDTRNFVTDYLAHYRGMVLVISHDISFLNHVVTQILKVDKMTKKIEQFHGNYDDYVKKEQQKQEQQARLVENQEKEIASLQKIVLQYSNSSGKRKRMAQSREKTLQKKMEARLTLPPRKKSVSFKLLPKREGSKIPIKVNTISFGYDTLLFQNLSFVIPNQERFLIVGKNGVGKTTLLKLLASIYMPKEGSIWFGNKTDIAYYAQEQEVLESDKTILENVSDSAYSEKELRTVLGSFLFFNDDVYKKVSVLSFGERARVALCKMLLPGPNLLLLDEPTNHLDPDTQEKIGALFRDYPGTIILVSHNPSFIKQIGINRMMILPSGKITNYSDDKLEYYLSLQSLA